MSPASRSPATARGRLLLGLATTVLLGRGAAAQPCQTVGDCGINFDRCTIASCDGGQCRFTAPDCSDGDACTTDACDSNLGCVHGPLCPDDGLVCNGAPSCMAIRKPPYPPIGFCLPPVPLDCNAHSQCSIDSCVEPVGCQHVTVDCGDGDPCTADSCDPATGCHHDPIAGCCRTGTDCPTDACSTRECTAAHVCTDPTPISCDDGDPTTVDGCDPATGCTHRPGGGTTTTTVPDGGSPCTADGDCSTDGDPCVQAACGADRRCTTRAVTGFARLGCVCGRPVPVTCAGQAYPAKMTRLAGRACALVEKAQGASGARRVRLLRKIIGLFTKADGAAVRATKKGTLTQACGDAAGVQLTDAVSRAKAVRVAP